MQLKAESYSGICAPYKTDYSGLHSTELIALSYLKGKRDKVVKTGFSSLCSFDGRHRAGKSVQASIMSYLWDETFFPNFEHRIVQDHIAFIDVMEKIAKDKIKGACVIVDEAGIAMSSADWYEKWLKNITYMVQMFGYLYPVVQFVAPVKDFVDSRLRKMFHHYYKVNRNNLDYAYITPYDLYFSTIGGKYYHKKPTIRLLGMEYVVRRLVFSKPPPIILDRYRELEIFRKDKMFDKFIEDAKKSEIKEQKQEVDINKLIDTVIKNYKFFEADRSNPNEPKLNPLKIEFANKINPKMAKYIKIEAEKKIRDNIRELAEKLEREKKV